MMERCGNCIHRGARNDSGCTFSGALPIIPNPDSKCVFLKDGGESKFEPDLKREQHGKLIAPHESADPSPGVEFIRSDPIRPTGFSDVIRPDLDGNPCTYRVRDGLVYSVEDKYLGTMDEVFPPGPSKEEQWETYQRVKTQLLEEFE